MSLNDGEATELTKCPICDAAGNSVYVADSHPTSCTWMMRNLHRCFEHDELLLPSETECPVPESPNHWKDPHKRYEAQVHR